MGKFIDIKSIIDEYITLMDTLIDFEQKKLDAVYAKDNEVLNAFLKEEQVYLLQLRGLDQKREKLQVKLGIETLTYRDIISLSEGDEQKELQSSYEILENKTNQFKNLIDTIKTHIEIRLHTIEATMERFGANTSTETGAGIYDKLSANSSNQDLNSGFNKSSSRFKSTKV